MGSGMADQAPRRRRMTVGYDVLPLLLRRERRREALRTLPESLLGAGMAVVLVSLIGALILMVGAS